MEKEHTIASMQKQIEDLKRRAEQGSQQLQGEVQELALEEILSTKFPHDTIEPVPKGNTAETFYSVFAGHSVSAAEQSCGNLNVPRTGVTHGLGNCVKINEQQRQKSQ
jgi:hypothetical protein